MKSVRFYDKFMMKSISLILALSLLTACNKKKIVTILSSYSCKERRSPHENIITDSSKYFKVPKTLSFPTVILSGRAEYKAKVIKMEAESFDEEIRPIRHALLIVKSYNTNNNNTSEIQYAYTKENGNFSFTVPKDPDEKNKYTLEVRTQVERSKGNFAIFNCPEEQKPYTFVSETFSLHQDKGELNLTLEEEQTTGAFHIFNLLLTANDILMKVTRDPPSDCSNSNQTNSTYCKASSFSIPSSLDSFLGVYWDYGFNPNFYYSVEDLGVSFVINSYKEKRMFILGGISGDTKEADTDHFDDSVILHEYWHYLDYFLSKTSSPGGSHDRGGTFDPRLAYSEAMSDFFSIFTLTDKRGEDFPYYIDFLGGEDSLRLTFSTKENVLKESVEYWGEIDIPRMEVEGEGNYRETSITRTLWKMYKIEGNTPDDKRKSYLRIYSALRELKNSKDYIDFSHFLKSYLIFFKTDSIASCSTSVNVEIQNFLTEEKQDQTPYFKSFFPSSSSCPSSIEIEGVPYLSTDLPLSPEKQQEAWEYTHPQNNLFFIYTPDIYTPEKNLSFFLELENSNNNLSLYLLRKNNDTTCPQHLPEKRLIKDWCLVGERKNKTRVDLEGFNIKKGEQYIIWVNRFVSISDIIKGDNLDPVNFSLKLGNKYLCQN